MGTKNSTPERANTAKPGTLRHSIEDAMWDEYEESGKIEMTREEIISRLTRNNTMPTTPSGGNQVSAQLSHMKNEGIVLPAGNTKGFGGRNLLLYTLEAIADIATKPKSGATPGPAAKIPHVNRPPLHFPSKEVIERKAAERKALESNTSPAEKTATGVPIASVPAHQFSHYDGNSGGGKLTTERRPEKPQDPEAVKEMVQHIRNTEGDEMAVGAPKHGTDEAVFAEYDKRINRLSDMLEKAVDQIAKSNREGIAKQEVANEENAKAAAQLFAKVTSIAGDNASSIDANNEVFRSMVNELLKLWIDSTNGQNIAIKMMDNVMKAMKEVIIETRNSEIIRAKAYAEGWEAAKSQMENDSTPNLPITETINETAIRAEELAKKFGIHGGNIIGNVPSQDNEGEKSVGIIAFDLFGEGK